MGTASRALIEDAVIFIEDHLKEALSLSDISAHLHVSKYHLLRLFRSLTGLPLMSYVRRRRLSSSVTDLLDTDMRIIDIAEEYHFEYEQTYQRAFKRLFGMSPAEFRRTKIELPIDHRLDCGLIYDLPQGILLSPRYCILPTFSVAGIEELINHRENREKITANALALYFHTKIREKIPHRVNDHIYYGIITYGEDPDTANYYMPSVEVARVAVGEGMSAAEDGDRREKTSSGSTSTIQEQMLTAPLIYRTLVTQTYAVFRYIGFHAPEELSMQNLGELYDLIDKNWYPKTSHQQAAPYHMERMDLHNCSSTYCETDIYIPVRG
ncbi:MAG: helix-turn-helix domain-containing protein [Clostridiaceae bacterium]|nr:helix-turn-helix domain-containing protein [Clostridiaceae bacterium]